jgi:hypothetical protein
MLLTELTPWKLGYVDESIDAPDGLVQELCEKALVNTVLSDAISARFGVELTGAP